MPESRENEEIEIEQIDLELDQSYDISIDVSSIEPLRTETEEEARILEEGVSGGIEETSGFGIEPASGEAIGKTYPEEMGGKESEVGGEPELVELEEMESMVSISNEELDEILSGAVIKEEEGKGVKIEEMEVKEEVTPFSEVEEPEKVSLGTKIGEEILEEPTIVEGVSIGEEVPSALSIGEEISAEKETPEIVVMSTEEYNRIVEENREVPIVEKPLEEVLVELSQEEYKPEETVFPEELGISAEPQEVELSEEFELKEFEEVSEETIIKEKLGIEEELVGPDIESLSDFQSLQEKTAQDEIIEKELIHDIKTNETKLSTGRFEIVDDISLELETPSRREFSVMPDEVGIEEISVDTAPKATKEEIEILGIGFEEIPAKATQEEEQVEMVVGEILKPSIPEAREEEREEIPTSIIAGESLEEIIPKEEKLIPQPEIAKIERAIDSLSEEEKEDIRKVLLYLDELLGSLPEDKIKEFASSEYYELYVKLFDKLNLK